MYGLSRSGNQNTGDIIEAEEIVRLEDDCVSVPLISLTAKELTYLHHARVGTGGERREDEV